VERLRVYTRSRTVEITWDHHEHPPQMVYGLMYMQESLFGLQGVCSKKTSRIQRLTSAICTIYSIMRVLPDWITDCDSTSIRDLSFNKTEAHIMACVEQRISEWQQREQEHQTNSAMIRTTGTEASGPSRLGGSTEGSNLTRNHSGSSRVSRYLR